MGVDTESARFLLGCRRRGTDFSRCLVLGRQNYFLGNRESRALMREFGVDPETVLARLGTGTARYADPFFEALGATHLETMDASGYEGASIVHDLNVKVPESLGESFTTVCDVGTIEHVFHFPTAIQNAMSMVRVGGDLILHTTANNYFGHGFYQFSPELLFRILSAENGFKVTRMIAVEYGCQRRWFEVADPEVIRKRVTLHNACPVLLFVCARRTNRCPLLAQTPQQSDYVALWDGANEGSPPPTTGGFTREFGRWLLENAPVLARSLEHLVGVRWNQTHRFDNPEAYRRLRGRERN